MISTLEFRADQRGVGARDAFQCHGGLALLHHIVQRRIIFQLFSRFNVSEFPIFSFSGDKLSSHMLHIDEFIYNALLSISNAC